MPPPSVGPRRRFLAMIACAEIAAGVARGQVAPGPPTVESSSRIAGAVPSESMDTGPLPADLSTQATVNDSYSGPIQLGGVTVGSANVVVRATSREGTAAVFSQTSVSPNLASLSILTSAESQSFDSLQVTKLPAGQGELLALYLPKSLAGSGTVTGSGAAWSTSVRLTATVEDFASDGTIRGSFTLAADYSTGSAGPLSHDTAPITIPIQLNDTLTVSIDEVLQTSTTAAPGFPATVTADFSKGTHVYLVPLSPGLVTTSASGHSYLPPAGDANVDGKVDFADLLILAQHYGQVDAAWPQGDFNADGKVDFGDLLAQAQNYGTSIDAVIASGTSIVPEPAWGAAFAAGVLGLFPRRTRLPRSPISTTPSARSRTE